MEYFRGFYPVKTICMHGSPLSKWDNREIWKKYDYKKLGLIGEPYFDIDFSKVLYLTDTGRRWDGERVSVRDKVQGSKFKVQDSKTTNDSLNAKPSTLNKEPLTLNVKHTKDIIHSIEAGRFPNQAMITIHPQRWTNSYFAWTKELALQNVKNVIKRGLILYR